MVETTEGGYVDLSDDDSYEGFDNYLAKGQERAMTLEEVLHDARQLATQVRDGEITMDEYDDSETVKQARDAIEAVQEWVNEPPRYE